MTNKKTTKRALIASAVSFLLCFTMLLGTTYAWFTDSVTSAGNKIVSGSLQVDLEVLESGSWVSIKDDPHAIFTYENWEPGYTEVKFLKVVNDGTLALKWKAMLTPVDSLGILADVIDVYVKEYDGDATPSVPASRDLTADGWTKLEGTLRDFIKNMETTTTGELEAGESEVLGLAFKMQESAGNDYQDETLGAFDIMIFAAQLSHESDSFDDQYDADAQYPVIDTYVTANNIDSIDFTMTDKRFVFVGSFETVEISEIGEGSVLVMKDSEIGALKLSDDAVISGTGKFNKLNSVRNGAEAITLTITDAEIDVANDIGVYNTDALSVLNIENSKVYFGTIFVGEHTNNHRAALAEFNVKNSYLSGEENGMGSTIGVWGRSGVKSTIYDSEIHTYSRGWHQSEDANDNAITFQGATSIDIDIQRSNMHLYGARSIINARQYGSEETTVNFTIDESLIWTVTKSNHGDNTIPVWGCTEITDSILLFTKNVHQSTPAVFKSFVYGDPVIHGNYNVTTQCGWDAEIQLADGQTVTFAKDANVSIYDGATGKVSFVPNGSAKVVVENGAVVKNIEGVN